MLKHLLNHTKCQNREVGERYQKRIFFQCKTIAGDQLSETAVTIPPEMMKRLVVAAPEDTWCAVKTNLKHITPGFNMRYISLTSDTSSFTCSNKSSASTRSREESAIGSGSCPPARYNIIQPPFLAEGKSLMLRLVQSGGASVQLFNNQPRAAADIQRPLAPLQEPKPLNHTEQIFLRP